MQNAYVVTGHLIDERTVALDEELPMASAQVRLVVEPVGEARPGSTRREVLARIRAQQSARGFVPSTAAQVQTLLHNERASWD